MQVGDVVTLKQSLFEEADEYAPGGYLAYRGDRLVVRKVLPKGRWTLLVSHEGRTDDKTFAVSVDEVEKICTVQPSSPTPPESSISA